MNYFNIHSSPDKEDCDSCDNEVIYNIVIDNIYNICKNEARDRV